MTNDINEKLEEWHNLSRSLTIMVEREKALRLEIFGQAFPTPVVGTNRVAIGFGKDLKATHRINYKIDRAMMELESHIIPTELFHNVIKYRPEVAQGPWLAMTIDERKLFGSFVIETPGTPALEIVNSKARR